VRSVLYVYSAESATTIAFSNVNHRLRAI